jgi:hypothetical protein
MSREIKFRQPIFGFDGSFREFYYWGQVGEQWISPADKKWHGTRKITDPQDSLQYTGFNDESDTEIYVKDIVDVCVFLVSPENPDNDHHFRGVIEEENGCIVFVIHKYLKFDGDKSEWVDIQPRHLPFYEAELDEDGTFTVIFFNFCAISGNLGEYLNENVTIVGNVYTTPELLNQQ